MLNLFCTHRTYRTVVVQGVVELIRDDEDDDLLAQTKEDDIYIFKQSELTNKEAPRDTVIIEEDKPGNHFFFLRICFCSIIIN